MRKLRPMYAKPSLGAAAITTLVLGCASQQQEGEAPPDPYDAPLELEDNTRTGDENDALPPDTGEPPLGDSHPDSAGGAEDPLAPGESAAPNHSVNPEEGPAQ